MTVSKFVYTDLNELVFENNGSVELAKAEGDNPLIDAMANRPLNRRVRTSVSRLTAREREIYDSVQAAVAALTRGADRAFVRRLVVEGVERVVNGISATQFVSELEPMVRALTNEVGSAGSIHTRSLPNQIGASMRFDYLDPRAVQWANQRAGELITSIVDEQREMLRDIISEGVSEQLTVDEIGRNVRDVIGLPESWAGAVPKARAAEFAKLISSGRSIAEANNRADQVAERYKERLIRARAKTIARTEIMTAQNQGRWLSWAQGTEQGFIPKNARKEWIAAPGIGPKPHLCEICKDLNGIQTEWDKEFPGTNVNMPPIHPNCRCTAVIVPFDMKALEQAVAIPQENYDAAQAYLDELGDDESVITQEVKDLAEQLGGEPVGLEHRYKSRNSLTRKAWGDMQRDNLTGGSTTFEQAMRDVKDSVRYTISLPSADYADGVRSYLFDLRAQGVQFNSKIRWSRPDVYQGVNLQVKHPGNGRWYELQFHTPDSLLTKAKNHPYYEKQRRIDVSDPEYQDLTDKMMDIVGRSPVPPKITQLIGLIL